jgi:YesN/AraC family two-component response regulator
MASISDSMASISILLAEDEELILELLASILTSKFPDLKLYTANNGRNGLELFKTHTPDIVITDIHMPKMSGVQMSEKIRAIKQETKFIVLTGKNGKLILQGSVEKGFEFDHVIVKPIVFQELFGAIEQCIGEISGANLEFLIK